MNKLNKYIKNKGLYGTAYSQGKFDLLMDLDRKLKSHIFIKSIEINGEKI